MTHAIFDTWLRGSTRQSYDEDTHTLTIAVKNQYAVEWPQDRLYNSVERTLRYLTGNGTRPRFIVAPTPAPPLSPSPNPIGRPLTLTRPTPRR